MSGASSDSSNLISALATFRLTNSRPLYRYSFAVIFSVAGLACEYFMQPMLGDLHLVLLYPICFLVIAVAGLGPACLAILINTLGATYFFIESKNSFFISDSAGGLKLLIFSLSSTLIAALLARNLQAEKKLVKHFASIETEHNLRLLQYEQEHRARQNLDHLLARTHQSEERLRLATTATGIGIWESKPEQNYLYWSPEVRSILRIPDEVEPTRENWMDHIHPADHAHLRQQIAKALDPNSKEEYRAEVRCHPQPGEPESWVIIRGQPYFSENGTLKRFVGTLQDITARKMNEVVLEKAKEEAESANALKSAFLANMSHEIRTPLGAMLGFMELLKEPNLPVGEQQKYINIVSRNGLQLSQIINDILDISKIEAGHLKLEYATVAPSRIAQEVATLMSVKAQEQGIDVEVTMDSSTPTTMVTDPLRLKQILSNILGNAVKFTPQGKISIAVSGQPGGVVFKITDTGSGIPPHQQEAIFQIFVQADASMARQYEGTGLGLPLSRRLARSLGGDVVLQSSSDRGSVFVTTIADRPALAPAPAPPVKKESTGRTDLSGVRILLVEDSEDNQQLIQHFLAKTGADIEIADNGMEGYEKAIADGYDLVLMDIQMPQMDGYSVTKKLRDEGYKKPIIALTAHAMPEFRAKGLEAGCDDYLSKPIDRGLLVSTIEKHLF